MGSGLDPVSVAELARLADLVDRWVSTHDDDENARAFLVDVRAALDEGMRPWREAMTRFRDRLAAAADMPAAVAPIEGIEANQVGPLFVLDTGRERLWWEGQFPVVEPEAEWAVGDDVEQVGPVVGYWPGVIDPDRGGRG